MSALNPMALANDWFNAFRAKSLSIVDFYSEHATLECSCGGRQVLVGRTAIASYWEQRFVDRPAGVLCDLTDNGHAIVLSYWVADGIAYARLYFDDDGKIARCQCYLMRRPDRPNAR